VAVLFIEDFERKCSAYTATCGHEPLHQRDVLKAFESGVGHEDRIRRSRIAAEATLLFVLKERGGEALYQKTRQNTHGLNNLILTFNKNMTLRASLCNLDGWNKVEAHLKHLQTLGNRASHHNPATLYVSLTGGVNDSLEAVVRWAWIEADIVDEPTGRFSQTRPQVKDAKLPVKQVPDKQEPAEVLTDSPTPARASDVPRSTLFRDGARVVGLALFACGVALCLLSALGLSGWDMESLLDNGRSMNADAPAQTRPSPTRRDAQPRR
jgi:hypothetical protein